METKQQKHTELHSGLPWQQIEDREGLCIFSDRQLVAEAAWKPIQRVGMGTARHAEAEANARYIVLSANYHERLVETLKAFTESRALIEPAMQSHGPLAECLCNGCHLKRMFDGAESLLAEIEREEK